MSRRNLFGFVTTLANDAKANKGEAEKKFFDYMHRHLPELKGAKTVDEAMQQIRKHLQITD